VGIRRRAMNAEETQAMEAEYEETALQLRRVRRQLRDLGREFSSLGRMLVEEPGKLPEDLLGRLPLDRTRYLLGQCRELGERKEALEGWLGVV
jgi:hypothetical protein